MGNAQAKDANTQDKQSSNANTQDKQSSNANTQSKDANASKDVGKILDYVATNYILTMDFESLKKLYTKQYCDKLIVLTSDIIQKYFTNMDITYLSNKIKKKDNLIYINRDDLETIEDLDLVKKRELCNGIAKFYITIAHIFSCIITTINPQYVFKDLDGEYKKISLSEKNEIPFGVKTKIIKYNICDNRISSLKNNSTFDKNSGDLTINPSFCNINLNDDGELKSLIDEPGIPELLELYNDDQYNFERGIFSGMSPETKQMFQENLKIFYTTFTGNSEMPQEITKFSDIKLRDYDKDGKCSSNLVNNPVDGNISNELFKQYADNLKEMIAKSNKNRENLINILNKLFVYFIDEETKSKRIRVNPSLTEDSLKDIVMETRSAVVKLYLTCEQDYIEGIKIYEAIVEQKILETSQKQIQTLTKMRDELISSDENIILPEDKIIDNAIKKEQIMQSAKEQIQQLEPAPQPQIQPTIEPTQQLEPPQAIQQPLIQPTIEPIQQPLMQPTIEPTQQLEPPQIQPTIEPTQQLEPPPMQQPLMQPTIEPPPIQPQIQQPMQPIIEPTPQVIPQAIQPQIQMVIQET